MVTFWGTRDQNINIWIWAEQFNPQHTHTSSLYPESHFTLEEATLQHQKTKSLEKNQSSEEYDQLLWKAMFQLARDLQETGLSHKVRNTGSMTRRKNKKEKRGQQRKVPPGGGEWQRECLSVCLFSPSTQFFSEKWSQEYCGREAQALWWQMSGTPHMNHSVL